MSCSNRVIFEESVYYLAEAISMNQQLIFYYYLAIHIYIQLNVVVVVVGGKYIIILR